MGFDAEQARRDGRSGPAGLRTVPQIFIHGRHVGGYDELAALEREGKLERGSPMRSRRSRGIGTCAASTLADASET